MPPRILYGHRGASAEQPENTLPAFRRALDAGATAIETDVRLTADGSIVLSHDPTGTRMAGVDKAIRDCTLAEVQSWDVGWGFVDNEGRRPFVGKGYRIPTLEQALVEFPGVRFNVDVKPNRPAVIDPLLTLLKRLRAEDRVLLTSFHSSVLRSIRRRGYPGPTGLSRNEVLCVLLSPRCLLTYFPVKGCAVQIPTRAGPFDLSTPDVLNRCHALGLRVDYWTIDHPAEAHRLLALGADGIVTNDPAAIAPVFRLFATR